MICQNCQYLHILSKSIRFAKIHTICQNQQVSQNPHDLSKSTGNCLNPQGFWKICTIDKIRNNCQIPQVFSKSSQFAKVRMNCQNLPGFWKIRNLPKSARFSKICTLKISTFLQKLHNLPKSAGFLHKIHRVFQKSARFAQICFWKTTIPRDLPKSAHFAKINTICQNLHDFCFHNFFESAKMYTNCQNPQDFTKNHTICQNLHKLSKSVQFAKICRVFEKLHDFWKIARFAKIHMIYQNPQDLLKSALKLRTDRAPNPQTESHKEMSVPCSPLQKGRLEKGQQPR